MNFINYSALFGASRAALALVVLSLGVPFTYTAGFIMGGHREGIRFLHQSTL